MTRGVSSLRALLFASVLTGTAGCSSALGPVPPTAGEVVVPLAGSVRGAAPEPDEGAPRSEPVGWVEL